MSVSVSSWIASWINQRSLELRPSTISGYRRLLRLYIDPSIGSIPLPDLRAEHVTVCLSEIMGEGKPRQAQLTRILVAASLKSAVKLGILPFSPMDHVPRIRHKAAFTPWWTSEQLSAFLRASIDDPFRIAWLLALTCGLRRGELLGLRWVDVDLSSKIIKIRRQRVIVDGKTIEGPPKSDAGIRDIPIPPDLLVALQQARKASKSLYVISSSLGSPCSAKSLRRAHKQAIARACVPDIPLHGMRHTMASLAAAAGVSIKVLQSILGHAHYSTTADIYTHVEDAPRRAAMAAISSLISDQLPVWKSG